MTQITEITLVEGGRYRVRGDIREVEQVIIDAARGSIMELAWLLDAGSGHPLAVNPACVVLLRALES